MSLAGMGVVAIWHDLLPEARTEFYEWHNREHMPERVGVPGIRRGRRYVSLGDAPEFFNLYEADSLQVLAGLDYLNRLNAPTAWTRRVVPSFRNVARSICAVAFTSGVGSGGVMLTSRFEMNPADRAGTLEALTQRLLQPLAFRAGITGIHLCLADEGTSRIETAEKKVRGDTTLIPTSVVLIEGNSAADVRGAFDVLAPALQALKTSVPDTAIYRLEFTRLKTPWSAG
jgi:hypothetical protein